MRRKQLDIACSLIGWVCSLMLSAEACGQRVAVPSASEQQAKQREIQEVFALELANAKTPLTQKALAKRLINLARETEHDSAAHYVLLLEAHRLAEKGGDAALAAVAMAEISARFLVDGLALEARALEKMARAKSATDAGEKIAEKAMIFMDMAWRRDRFEIAERMESLLKRSKRKKGLGELIDARLARMHARRDAFAGVKDAIQRAATLPVDPSAKLSAGQYLCFVAGNWSKGLPLLVEVVNSPIANLVRSDLAMPAGSADRLLLANGWWDAAGERSDVEARTIRRRAAFWYGEARGEIAGLHRALAEKRLAQVRAESVADIEEILAFLEAGWTSMARHMIEQADSLEHDLFNKELVAAEMAIEVAERPADVEFFEKAMAYRASRDPLKLLGVLKKLKKSRPESPLVHFGLGEVYGSTGHVNFSSTRAAVAFEKFLDLTTDEKFGTGEFGGGSYTKEDIAASIGEYSTRNPGDNIEKVRQTVQGYLELLKKGNYLLLVTSPKTIASFEATARKEISTLYRKIETYQGSLDRVKASDNPRKSSLVKRFESEIDKRQERIWDLNAKIMRYEGAAVGVGEEGSNDLLFEMFREGTKIYNDTLWRIEEGWMRTPELDRGAEDTVMLAGTQGIDDDARIKLQVKDNGTPSKFAVGFAFVSVDDYHLLEVEHQKGGQARVRIYHWKGGEFLLLKESDERFSNHVRHSWIEFEIDLSPQWAPQGFLLNRRISARIGPTMTPLTVYTDAGLRGRLAFFISGDSPHRESIRIRYLQVEER